MPCVTPMHVASVQDVAIALFAIFKDTKSENLKATTASTLSRLLRSSPTLLSSVMDKQAVRLVVAGQQHTSMGCHNCL